MGSGDPGARDPVALWRAHKTPEEYDIEVSIFHGALKSFKKTAVLNPFPKSFIVDGERCYGGLRRVADALPTPTQLYTEVVPTPGAAAPEGGLQLAPDVQDLLLFLYDNSNLSRCSAEAIVDLRLDDPEQLPQRVYKLSHADVARNQEFDNDATAHGSHIAYHGSAVGNWFCIGKNGLRNFSGTAKQANGALFGDGIYLSSKQRLASDFSTSGDCWARSEMGTNLRIVSRCEYITSPETLRASNDLKSSGGKVPEAYIVIPNAVHCRVTHLLVFVQPKAPAAAAATRLSSFAMVVFYIVLLVVVVMAQHENRVLFRAGWRQLKRAAARGIKHMDLPFD